MPTNEITVHLWANAPGGHIPSVSFETDDEMRASALALRHFRQLGLDFSISGAHVDVDLPNGDTGTVYVRDVLAWLRQPAQSKFVADENLSLLL